MNLYIDIGNSAIKFGVDENDSVRLLFFVNKRDFNATDILKSLPQEVENIYVSSVAPNGTDIVKSLCYLAYKKEIIEIKSTDECGVKIKIDDPKELGTDLLCDLAAGKHFYGCPILIIDAGTATKILYIDENNEFFSCAITPGLELQLNMLASGTALLPNSEVKEVKPLLECHNTIDVITSSSYYSHVDMINGLINRYEKEIGHPVRKIITGGNILKIKGLLDFEYDYDPLLCLKGIKVIGERR